jgi:hypothetical protein
MRNKEKTALPPEAQALLSQPHNNNKTGYSVPVDVVDLPSKGRFYSKQHPLHNKEHVEIKYMTTKEEDILLNRSFHDKGVVFDKLIESLLVNEYIKADSLLVGDKNSIIINARKSAYGPEYPIEIACEVCNTKTQHAFDLSDMGIVNQDPAVEFTEDGTFLVTLPKTKATLEARLLTSGDESDILKRIQQKAKHGLPEAPTTERYRQVVVSVNGERNPIKIAEFISNMPIRDSRHFTKIYNSCNPDVNFTFSMECDSCTHVNKGVLPITGDFFWPDE